MNYYPFHVGDYAAHTSHLEPMEDLAYRRLLDVYYLRECPLPADVQITAKLVRMRSMISDVESVLNEFFTLTPDGWTHARCNEEIAHMQDKQAKARASAAASVKSRQAFAAKKLQASETNVTESVNEHSTDVETNPTDVQLPTPTPTPTPIEDQKIKPARNKRASPSARIEVSEDEMLSSGVPKSVANEYLRYRRAKNAPLTPLAWRRILSEINKSGIDVVGALSQAMARGWQGFEASWLQEKNRAGPSYAESPADQRSRKKHDFWEQINGTGSGQQRGAVPAAIDGEAVRVD